MSLSSNYSKQLHGDIRHLLLWCRWSHYCRTEIPTTKCNFGGITLNLWSIPLYHKGTKLHKTDRIAFPLFSLCNSCSNRQKLTDLFTPSLSKHNRAGYIFLLLAHSWMEKRHHLEPTGDNKSVAVFLNMRQPQPGRIIFRHNQWSYRPRSTFLTTYLLHQ